MQWRNLHMLCTFWARHKIDLFEAWCVKYWTGLFYYIRKTRSPLRVMIFFHRSIKYNKTLPNLTMDSIYLSKNMWHHFLRNNAFNVSIKCWCGVGIILCPHQDSSVWSVKGSECITTLPILHCHSRKPFCRKCCRVTIKKINKFFLYLLTYLIVDECDWILEKNIIYHIHIF